MSGPRLLLVLAAACYLCVAGAHRVSPTARAMIDTINPLNLHHDSCNDDDDDDGIGTSLPHFVLDSDFQNFDARGFSYLTYWPPGVRAIAAQRQVAPPHRPIDPLFRPPRLALL